MKKALSACFVALVCVFIAAAPQYIAAEDMPGADADALWKYITETSPYQKWGMWPDHSGMQPGRAPHGPFHINYVNDILLKATKTPVPYGSIQVKDNYMKDKTTLAAVTVMYKVKGFNPDDGDWFWVKYSPDGKADKAGKVKGCISCHGTRARNDFILVHDF